MKKILFIVINTIYIYSCSNDPYASLNINSNSFDYEIAVSGYISTCKDYCEIRITKPILRNESFEFEDITDAIVILKDNGTTYSFKYFKGEFGNGKYRSIDSIVGVAGVVYELTIQYDKKIYTALEIMPPLPSEEFNIPLICEISEDSFDEYISVTTHQHNFGYDKTNIWVYTIISNYNDNQDSLDGYSDPIIVCDNQDFRNTGLTFTHKGSIPQGSFAPSFSGGGTGGMAIDSISILKAGISDEYEKYLSDKFNETDWQGSIFSTIPDNVSTNFSDGALGYFYALNIKEGRFLLKDLFEK